MTATSTNDLRALSVRELADERMEQVRELLVGDAVRHLEARLAELETRVAETELGVVRQLDALEAKIMGLAGGAEEDRRASFEALASSISDLGEQIRRISRA